MFAKILEALAAALSVLKLVKPGLLPKRGPKIDKL